MSNIKFKEQLMWKYLIIVVIFVVSTSLGVTWCAARQAEPSVTTLIIGGENVPVGELEHCVAVGNKTRYFCSGTLITPRLVLTAKHCLLGGVKEVFFGRQLGEFSRQLGKKIEVIQEKEHPTADIAVLVLKSNSTVQPARIGQECHLKNTSTATIAGFGATNVRGTDYGGVKRFVKYLPIVDPDCSAPNKSGCTPGLEMVAGFRAFNRDTCRGDSGGPLYINNNGERLLIGATSRPAKKEEGDTRICGDGGIYVRVDKFTDWIEQTTGISIVQAPCR